MKDDLGFRLATRISIAMAAMFVAFHVHLAWRVSRQIVNRYDPTNSACFMERVYWACFMERVYRSFLHGFSYLEILEG